MTFLETISGLVILFLNLYVLVVCKNIALLTLRRNREVVNLQRTLDAREHDFDQLAQSEVRLQKVVTLQKVELAKLRSDSQKLRAVAANVHELEAQLKVPNHWTLFTLPSPIHHQTHKEYLIIGHKVCKVYLPSLPFICVV